MSVEQVVLKAVFPILLYKFVSRIACTQLKRTFPHLFPTATQRSLQSSHKFVGTKLCLIRIINHGHCRFLKTIFVCVFGRNTLFQCVVRKSLAWPTIEITQNWGEPTNTILRCTFRFQVRMSLVPCWEYWKLLYRDSISHAQSRDTCAPMFSAQVIHFLCGDAIRANRQLCSLNGCPSGRGFVRYHASVSRSPRSISNPVALNSKNYNRVFCTPSENFIPFSFLTITSRDATSVTFI